MPVGVRTYIPGPFASAFTWPVCVRIHNALTDAYASAYVCVSMYPRDVAYVLRVLPCNCVRMIMLIYAYTRNLPSTFLHGMSCAVGSSSGSRDVS